jgi:hypothetical protein
MRVELVAEEEGETSNVRGGKKQDARSKTREARRETVIFY